MFFRLNLKKIKFTGKWERLKIYLNNQSYPKFEREKYSIGTKFYTLRTFPSYFEWDIRFSFEHWYTWKNIKNKLKIFAYV